MSDTNKMFGSSLLLNERFGTVATILPKDFIWQEKRIKNISFVLIYWFLASSTLKHYTIE